MFCRFALMKNYRTKRHTEIAKKLKDVSCNRINPTKDNQRIADKLKIGATTVFNYTQGRIKDGYLAEDILNLINQ